MQIVPISKQDIVNKYEQIDIVPTHYFGDDDIYIREVTLPADSIILGEIHKYSCMNIVSKGKILVVDVTSGEEVYIEAPFTFKSEAGTQKLAYVLEECVWSNVIHTNLTDIEEIEDKFLIRGGDNICHLL